MTSGIYKIKCLKNDRFYIGSSSNIEKRWQRHIRELKNNLHGNTHLQRAWLKYGENNFEFLIIEKCKKSKLIERENYYLQKMKPFSPKGFNIGTQAKGGDNITKNPNYEKICEKISKGGKARFAKMTIEEKLKYSENLKGKKNPNYGNKWKYDQKEKLSKKQKENFKSGKNKKYKKGKTHAELYGEIKAKEISKKISEFAKTRTGAKNAFFGKKHSEETKEKIRKKAIGRKPNNCKKISIDDIIYLSITEAHRQLNIHPTTIIWRLRSTNFPNYKYL